MAPRSGARRPLSRLATIGVATALAVGGSTVAPQPAASQGAFAVSAAALAPTAIGVSWTGTPADAVSVDVAVRSVPFDGASSAVVGVTPGAGALTWDEAVPGTTYEVELTAVLGDGSSVRAVPPGPVTTPLGSGPPPGAPTAETWSEVWTDDKSIVRVSWQASSTGAPTERVRVRLDTVPPDPAHSRATWSSAAEVVVDDLLPGTTYSVQLWAVAADGTLSEPVVPTGSPVTTAPTQGVPLDVVAEATSPTTIAVGWAPNPGAEAEPTGFQVSVSSDPSDPLDRTDLDLPGTATTATWDQAEPGHTYVVTVSALYAPDTAFTADPVVVTTPISTSPPPGVPLDASVEAIGTTVTIRWGPDPVGPPPERFRVRLEVDETASGRLCSPRGAWLPASATSFTVEVDRDCAYAATVAAVGSDGAFSDAARAEGSPVYVPLPPPEDVQVVVTSSTTAVVTWRLHPDAPADPMFRVRVEGPDGAQELGVGFPTPTELRLWSLEPETSYTVRVAAWGAQTGAFVPAEGVTVVTPPDIGLLAGTVTGPDGAPLAGAVVELYRPGDTWLPSLAEEVGPDGGYAFDPLPPDTYHLRVRPTAASGLRPHWYPATQSRAGARGIEVLGGAPRTGVDVAFPEPRSISGHVRGPDGSAVAGARVIAFRVRSPRDAWLGSADAVTAPDGSYALAGLDPGEYQIRVVPPAGSGLGPRWWPGRLSRNAAPTVELLDADRSGIDVAWPLPTSLTGRATGPGGSPLAGVRVAIFSPDDLGFWYTASTLTDADGRYALAALDPDTYTIIVAPPGGSGAAACWYAGGTSRHLATPVPVPEGQSVAVDVRCPGSGE